MLINIRTPDWLHLKFLFFKDHLRKPSNIDSKKHVVSGGHGSMGQYWPCWTPVKTMLKQCETWALSWIIPRIPGSYPKMIWVWEQATPRSHGLSSIFNPFSSIFPIRIVILWIYRPHVQTHQFTMMILMMILKPSHFSTSRSVPPLPSL